jgi:hypothetical protein
MEEILKLLRVNPVELLKVNSIVTGPSTKCHLMSEEIQMPLSQRLQFGMLN